MPGPQFTELDSLDVVGEFFLAYEGSKDSGWAPLVSMEIPSDRETEDIVWLGGAPEMRQWLGGRNVDSPDKKSFTATNVAYEATMGLRLADLRRDKNGFLRQRIADLGTKANEHWESLLSAELETNANGYDGQALYSVTHDETGSNQINLLTATQIPAANISNTAAPTIDEAADIIAAATGYTYTFTDDKSSPVNGGARSFLCMIGGSNQANFFSAFNGAVNSLQLNSGKTNAVPNLDWSVDVVMNPRLTSTSDTFVYFFITDSPVKATLRLDEEPVTAMLLAEGSDWEFHYKEHLFGVDATRTTVPGDWHKSVRVTVS